MGSITWKPNANGYWNVGANWSGGNEPGAADNVTLTSKSTHKIYFSTIDTVASLVSTDDLLVIQGGTLNVSGGLNLAGGLTQTAGLLNLGGGNDTISGSVTISAAEIALSNTTTLSLSGAVTFGTVNAYGAQFDGAGTLNTTGATSVTSTYNYANYQNLLGGGLTWNNTGTVIQSGQIEAFFTPGVAFTINNQVGALFDFAGGSIVNGTVDNNQGVGQTATSVFNNAGTLEDTGGGTSYIYSAVNNTGTINVVSGVLALENGGTLGGVIEGAGSLELTAGVFTLSSSPATQTGFAVEGATVAIEGGVNIAGGFTLNSGSIGLDGGTLSVASPTLIYGFVDGPGTFITTGATNFSSNYNEFFIAGNAEWINTGTVTQSRYNLYEGDGSGTGILLNQGGAVFDFTNNYGISNGASAPGTFINAGLLEKTGGAGISNIAASVTNSGTIDAAVGILQFAGGGTFAGALIGAGTIGFAGGLDTLAAGAMFGAAGLLVDGGTLVLEASFNPSSLAMSGGTLELDGNMLGVSGANLTGGHIEGPNTFDAAGTTTLHYVFLGGGVNLLNTGVVDQTGYIYGSDSDGAGIILNQAGATFDIIANSGIYSSGGIVGSFINAGMLERTGTGNSVFQDTIVSTGTIDIVSGILQFGEGGTFSGAIVGAGTIGFEGGVDVLELSTTLSAANLLVEAGTLKLGNEVNEAGHFFQTNGTIELDGYTLTVTGATLSGGEVDGSGTFETAGTTTLGNFIIGGGAEWINAGTVNGTANVIYGGDASGPGIILNEAGATFDFTSDFGIYNNVNSGTFINAGLLEANAGTSYLVVQDTVDSTGTIDAVSGTMEFTGGGTFGGKIIGSGIVYFDSVAPVDFGNLSIASTTTLQLGQEVTLTGNVTIADNLTYYDNGSPDVFGLNGNTLALTGNNTFGSAGGTPIGIDGPGAIVTSGTSTVQNYYTYDQMLLSGGAVWDNTGKVLDTGVIQLGSFDGAGSIFNTGTFNLTTDTAAITPGFSYDIYGNQIPVIGTVTNAGTFAKTGGTATNTISATFINTGTLQTNAGTLAFEDGGTLGGLVSASAHINLAGGDFFLGGFTDNGLLTDNAQIDQTGVVTLGAGTPLTINGIYEFDNDSSIVLGSTAATTIALGSSGVFAKIGGAGISTIAANFADLGSIIVETGRLDFIGAVTGAGNATIANGAALEFAGSVGSSLTVTMGTSSELLLDQPTLFKGKIANFVPGGTLDLGGLTITSATGSSSGTLTLKDGTVTVGTLTLAGNHSGDTYTTASDGHGGTLLGVGSNNSSWTGSTADWTTASDWSAGVPTTGTNATIAGTGVKTITIGAAESEAVKSFTLSNSNAILAIDGTLAIGTSFAQTGGTVELAGTINGGTIDVTGGDFAAVSDAATFYGVTYEGALDLTQANVQITVFGGSFTGSNGAGASHMTITGQSAGLFEEGVYTLNNAAIVLGNNSGPAYIEAYDPNDTGALFSLGTSVSVTQSGLYANIGDDSGNDTDGMFSSAAITAAVSGGIFTAEGNLFENDGVITVSNGDEFAITAANFYNAGTLNITGSTLDLATPNFTNTGSIALTNSTLDLADSLTTGQMLSLLTSGDTVELSGTLNNTGGILNLATASAIAGFTLDGGAIFNGTLALPGGTLAGAPGGELVNVTVEGGLALTNSSVKLDATTIDNAAGTAPGTISLNGASLEFDGYTSIANSISLTGGTIYVTGQPEGSNLSTGVDAFGNTLAAGSADPHWSVNITGQPAVVLNQQTWAPYGLNPNAEVIGAYNSNTQPPAPPYVFTETFTLTAAQAGIAELVGTLFVDNGGTLLLNGHSIASYSDNGVPESISGTNYFQAGVNTLAIDLTVGDQETDGAYFDGGLLSGTTIGAGTTESGTGLIADQPSGDGVADIINAGVIAANVAAGTLTIAPTKFYNEGILTASNGGVLAFTSVSAFGNLTGGTLSGGIYSVGAGSVIELANNSKITTDAADIILSGTASNIQGLSGSTQIKLDSTLATIASSGTLALLAGRNFTSTQALTDAGALNLGGTTFSATSLTIASTGTLSGFGSATNTIVNNGLIAALPGGTLKLAGVTGAGSLLIAAGDKLEIAGTASSAETVTFGAGGATLLIDSASTDHVAVTNFGGGDVLDFTSLANATATVNGTILSVTSGGTLYTETINSLASGTVLITTSDGHSGTDITAYRQAAASPHSPEPVAFGQAHVGDTLAQALTITNTSAPDGYSESLDGSFSSASANVTTGGSFSLLAPGSASSALTVTLATGSAGAESGSAIITLASDGTGTDGRGITSLGTQTVNLSATVFAYGTASSIAPVSLGQAHVGATLAQALTLNNSAAAGPYSENLDASFSGTTAGLTANGSISELAAGTTSTALSVTLAPTAAGVATGSATIGLVSDGTGIDTLASTTLASQTVAVSGTLFNYATAAGAPAAVNFGQRHVGAAASQFVVISNAATPGAYSENLDAGFSGTSLGLVANGGVLELAAGATSTNGLTIAISGAPAGLLTGATTLNLTSDGAGIDALGTTGLAPDTIAISGTLFNYATASTGPSVNFGERHAGSAYTQAVTIANTASAGIYSENLDASFSGTSSNLTGSGSVSELAAGGTAGTGLTLTMHSASGGLITGTATLKLTSDGSGIDTLGTTALAAQTIATTGTLFNYATASLASKTINFGIVHVGDTVSQFITISNKAVSGKYSEGLDANFSGTSANLTTTGTLSHLAAGSTNKGSLNITLHTSAAGTISGATTLKLTSDGAGIDTLASSALTAQNLTITGTVDNYATATIENIAGAGTLSGGGTTLNLNLGSVAAGGTLNDTIGVLNSATGPADLLGGSFATGTSTGFTDTGFGTFSNISAGTADTTLGISFSDLTAGTYSETIVLSAAGSNASGYSGTLAAETLVVTGTVTAGPQAIGTKAEIMTPEVTSIPVVGTNPKMNFVAPDPAPAGLIASSSRLQSQSFPRLTVDDFGPAAHASIFTLAAENSLGSFQLIIASGHAAGIAALSMNSLTTSLGDLKSLWHSGAAPS